MMHDPGMSDKLRDKLNDSIFLNAEEYAEVFTAVIEVPEQENVLENAFPIEFNRDPFNRYHQYTKLSHTGTAEESDVPGDADAVEVDGALVRTTLPFYHMDWVISEFDVRPSRRLGEPLDVVKAREASREVNNSFDAALYSSTAGPFGTLGAWELFTGSALGAAVWSGATPEAIVNDVVNFVGTVPNNYFIQNMRMLMNQTNWNEMHRTNAQGLSAMKLIRELYPQLQIVTSKQVTEGTAILFPVRKDVAYVQIGMPLRPVEWDAKAFESRFKAVKSGRLIVVAVTAGIRISNI